jgi:hypothetical protein
MGRDHRCRRIGGIVKAVREFEARHQDEAGHPDREHIRQGGRMAASVLTKQLFRRLAAASSELHKSASPA